MFREFANWRELFLWYLKRDWKKIFLWVLCLGIFAGAFVPAFVEIGKGGGLLAYYDIMKNPAMIAMAGPTPVKAAQSYDLGAMYSHMMLLFSALFAMIIAALHISSHTRREEENGLTEYICTFRVGRHANLLALFLEMILVHLILVLFTGSMMAAFGKKSMPGGECFLYAASIGFAGMMGTVIAMLMAQIMPTSGGTMGTSLGMVGLLYILRAFTDVSHPDLSVFNPMGWTYRTFPFTENDSIPLIFCGIFTLVIFGAAVLLEQNRDFGEGYIRESAGTGKVSPFLLSVQGLLLRLNRTVLICYLAAFAILGGAYGSIYGEMEKFLNSNELVRQMFLSGNGIAMEESFTSVIMVVMMCLTAILPIVVIHKLFVEEQNSHLEQVFATKVSRAELYFKTVGIATFAGILGCVISAASLGAVGISVMKESSLTFGDVLAAGLNFLPAILFMTALAACMVGWMPKFRKITYFYLGYSFMLNYFHGILDLPEWFLKTSVFSWIPRMPAEEFDVMVFAVMTIVSILMIGFGFVGYRKRDFS